MSITRIVALVFSACLVAQLLSAQEQPPAEEGEEPYVMVIEVGSRSSSGERTRTDTPVPVDVLPVTQIADEAGQLDVGQLLQYAAPSFNSNRQSGSDGSDHIDAATLRGLGPDQVLVLINGKRRHTSSLINLFGSRARGNVGTDLNTIPISAIERIEILRDGASAQYGSDAIAGVINIVLRKDAGLNLLAAGGIHSAGDGEQGQVAMYYGLPVGETGSLAVTTEVLNRNRTDRSSADEPRIIGDSATENITIFANLDLPRGDGSTVYASGGYSQRDGQAGAWYRGGVGSDDIPSRNSEAMYPDGFVPTIGTSIEDLSLTFGWRTILGEWSTDLSTTWGSNSMGYQISDTLNASIATLNGGISPTSFDAGGFSFTQHTTNFDVSRFRKDWLQGVNLASGIEYRREGYEIVAGDVGSWADFDGPGGGNAGSQGFPGFQPVDEIDASRHSTAVYVDVEMNLSPRFLLTTAVRGEDYSDFGSTVNGKVSFGYRLSDGVNLRGSASSGFRAPSLQQRFFSSTFTDFIAGEAADVKLAPNESELARLVGIPALREEESLNYSLGFTWSPNRALELTIDGYQIDIDDRIVLTGGFTGDDPDIGHIIRQQQLVEARFFTNAIDTRTRGIDLTLAHQRAAGAGRLSSMFAINYNETDVLHINTAPGLAGKEEIYFNMRERMFVEGSAPDVKASLAADYRVAKWSAGAKLVYFGPLESGTWSQIDDPFAPSQRYDGKTTTDLFFGYRLTDQLQWIVGGANVFNVQPTSQDPNETENGARWENVQMGINGAYFFSRLSWKLPSLR